MPVKFVNIGTANVSAGGTATVDFTAPESYTFKRIYFIETSGASLYDVDVTIKVEQDFITKDKIPAEIFSLGNRYNPELNLNVPKEAKLSIGFTNNKATAVNIVIVGEI